MKAKLSEAIELYGKEVVAEVYSIVRMSDPDCAFIAFQDQGMFEHAECVEFLFFG